MVHPLLCAVCMAQASATGEAAPLFGACEKSEDTCAYYRCISDVGFEHGQKDRAAELLAGYLNTHADEACLLNNLANLKYFSDRTAALDLYGKAGEIYLQSRQYFRAFWALSNQSELLNQVGRMQEASEAREKARLAADESGDLALRTQARIDEAMSQLRRGEDLAGTLRSLREVEGELLNEGMCLPETYTTCVSWLVAAGAVYRELSRYGEARGAYATLRDNAKKQGDLAREVTALVNLSSLRLQEWKATTSADKAREEIVAQYREILTKAQAAEQLSSATLAHLVLGKLLKGEEGQSELLRCVQGARSLKNPLYLSYCLDALAAAAAREDPAQAQRWLNEGRAVLLAAEDPWSLTHTAHDRMEVRWSTLAPGRAFEESLTYLDEIEALRELQTDQAGRAGLFSNWTEVYYELSGRVLSTAPGLPGPQELERAFQVIERLRARVLLDALETAGVPSSLPPELVERRGEISRDIVRIQRRLLDPTLSAEEKSEALGRLEAAEAAEAQLDHEIAQRHPDYLALRRPLFAKPADVAAALDENEALLSFQLSPEQNLFGEFLGGSWLLVITQKATRAYRLPERDKLEQDVQMVRSLMEQRETLTKPLVTLYDELLGKALDDLPPGIERLVILPDGALHLLPFTFLRASESDPPIVERFELSAAPSATLWLRWRQNRPRQAQLPALVLADPDLPLAEGSQGSELRAWLRDSDIVLRPLEYARKEGEAVVRYLGKPSVLQVGGGATERYLKSHDLGRFALLHFAAHALIDNVRSERSAILMAPGAETEDGLLQFRDILGLHLDGQVVVLSACQSATGTLLRGEGVLSLARAFFQAGAHTVVGSLWPLRDDEAAELFDSFYRHLAQGLSVAQALREAQLEAARSGAPMAAWAGVTALGDGDFVPFPGGLGEPAAGRRALEIVLSAGALAALGVLLLYLRHRRTLSKA